MPLYEMTWRFEASDDSKAQDIMHTLRSIMTKLPGGAIKQLRLTKVMDDE